MTGETVVTGSNKQTVDSAKLQLLSFRTKNVTNISLNECCPDKTGSLILLVHLYQAEMKSQPTELRARFNPISSDLEV